MEIGDLWPYVTKKIINSERKSASTVEILREHIDENQKGELDTSFTAQKHYFQVIINEMFLRNEREWFHKIDPVVYVVCEFMYARKPQIVPFLVGPGLLKQKGIPDEYASGIVIRNTSVSGLNPYRGGGLTLSVALCESRGDNLLRPLLRVIESTAKALDFSPTLLPYTKVARVVMDGFEELFNSGGLQPLCGLRNSFGPNMNVPFRPSYFAIIDKESVGVSSLWVKNRQLMQGGSLAASKPFRGADFVLYSFSSPEKGERDDVEMLPFQSLWDKVREEAKSPIDDPNYRNARLLMAALDQEITLSPDLTEDQADKLVENYRARMAKDHDNAKQWGTLSQPKDGGDEYEQRRAAARARALKELI